MAADSTTDAALGDLRNLLEANDRHRRVALIACVHELVRDLAYIRDDLSKWTRIVKDANVKVE